MKHQIKGKSLSHCLLSTTHYVHEAGRVGKAVKGPVPVQPWAADSGRAGAEQPDLSIWECSVCPLAQRVMSCGTACIKAGSALSSPKHCSGLLLLGNRVSLRALLLLLLTQASFRPLCLGCCHRLLSYTLCPVAELHPISPRCLATTCAHPKPAWPCPSPSLRAATSCARASAPTRRPSSSHRPSSSPSPAPSSAPSPSKPWWAPPEHPPLGAPWGWGASTAPGPLRARGASAPLADPTLLPAAPAPCPATAGSSGTPAGPAKPQPCTYPAPTLSLIVCASQDTEHLQLQL